LVFIPALVGDMSTAVAKNKNLVPWIQEQYSQGAEVASLCVGAFLLASTGLLNGKKCSTHWGFTNEFREMYPEVEVVDGSIVTEEKRIYSSGGANSYWNLLLHLVEKYTNRETAILASKYFAIDIDRDSQSAFAMFKGQKHHADAAILKAQEFIEKNIHERITIDELADMTAMGRRSFERRFKQATNNTVLEYIQRIKIEAAKRQFESSRKNINEVMYDVGYTDTKAFRNLFKKITGLTPIEYRNKYNKMVMA
ncbi:MAG: helix-turn-helix domain-containing protein, partial [Ferruginibacter sp.]